jgi:uncharacterized protein (TIGR00661 family)
LRVLYAVQGTGNGHLTRAKDVIPILNSLVDLDVMISGTQSEIDIDYPIEYRYQGISFKFGTKGGIDFKGSFKGFSLRNLIREIKSCPVKEYDLVINDFEAISAWACRFKGIPCVSLSHQAALLSDKIPRPEKRDLLGEFLIRNFAPCRENYGFHFKRYDKNIFTPLVRKDIRQLIPTNDGHYTVYLPAYSSKNIIKILTQVPEVKWNVFSKVESSIYQVENVNIHPIDSKKFIESMASGSGVLCGAGFETPSEALYLEKKLLVIPMKSQYEQHLNAESLKEIGVTVVKSLDQANVESLINWVAKENKIEVFFPDETKAIVEQIISKYEKKEVYHINNQTIELIESY